MTRPDSSSILDRRLLLATAAAVLVPRFGFARPDAVPQWQTDALAYLAGLVRADGGYAWDGAPYSHLTPTFAVVGTFHVLKQPPPKTEALTKFVRERHPFHLKKLERPLRGFDLQQIQALVWLGEDVSAFRDTVRSWAKPTVYPKQYEQNGQPVFRFEAAAFLARKLVGLPLDDLSPAYVGYLNDRRRPDGSFNTTPAADQSAGHVVNTLFGLEALRALGREGELKDKAVEWLRACQRPSGGFTYQPKPEFAGIDRSTYTHAAVRALALLGAAPADKAACVRYVHSLRNADGGFGDRPGWASNPMATYEAVDALAALGALDEPPSAAKALPAEPALPAGLKAFTIQIEAHGQGSPAEAVDLARGLRIHLWGAKNAKPEWIACAQAIADRDKVPVKFFPADEEYGTWVSVPGLGTYSHTSDVVAPPGADFGKPLMNAGVVKWPEFRNRRLAPLQKANGALVWQFGESEELTRVFLDDSVERGGFAAISTFHFGNPDFTNSEPFLYRYRGRIPFVGLQDAHGAEPWWFADMTTGFRTLFLAKEPTWEGWTEALRRNWVGAVRRDAVSRNELWMHTGSTAVRDAFVAQEKEWRWWNGGAAERPMVSVVVLRPDDLFEVGRPEKGLAVRVRCAWENTAQGLAKKPLVALVKLVVDGKEVSAELVAKKNPTGTAHLDHYHLLSLPKLAAGKHTVSATVRAVGTGAESSRTVEFTVDL
ncbi:prenyltransferase/squalene oxidase repeat-containing protein [Limnoglobus roseus]|uniref:Geranylgeranyl transferase type II subunit beta n=1 Tax=Limnoglobus roseus TaxID=2598579 RepID=A0A5C1AEU9_9BACT|nr:prenyltransferase/squalene oxidase repeat-containing protein [Limnoglobus roseus]QEL15644.1 hypothetical protein PX52LOC_02579 [Limnoglobus roseus]